jgi:hypothetical protein
MVVYNGDLYAGGNFSAPGGGGFANVLRWTGQTWVTVGTNYPRFGGVHCLTVYQGKLIAGGGFVEALGDVGNCVAAFDGTTWSRFGDGVGGFDYHLVYALTAFDPDGPGPLPELLIAGGDFMEVGGFGPNPQTAWGVAQWDGATWSKLGPAGPGTPPGVNSAVLALAVHDGQLAIGGAFTYVGLTPTRYFAMYGCPQMASCYANCDASTAAPLLNIADFTCFLQRFSAANPAANCDSSSTPPLLNIADFTCFLTKFAGGCP